MPGEHQLRGQAISNPGAAAKSIVLVLGEFPCTIAIYAFRFFQDYHSISSAQPFLRGETLVISNLVTSIDCSYQLGSLTDSNNNEGAGVVERTVYEEESHSQQTVTRAGLHFILGGRKN